MTNFNIYSYATIAEASAAIKRNGKVIRNLKIDRPTFQSPRPCFGFIWQNFSNDVRCEKEFTVDYDSYIFINRNLSWATTNSRKNFCALTDDEIDLYLGFVAQVAGPKFTINAENYKESNGADAFKGIKVHVAVKDVPFKHVMVICNMIRYMYEWPEAYNVKQMVVAFKRQLFYENFGQIFCLYESLMRNGYDQKISSCSDRNPSYIPIYTTEEMAEHLQQMDITKEAASYLRFINFKPLLDHTVSKADVSDLWQQNKQNEYKSDLYVQKDGEELDKALTDKITKLYKFVLMNDCI